MSLIGAIVLSVLTVIVPPVLLVIYALKVHP